jgi:hypothetical protein
MKTIEEDFMKKIVIVNYKTVVAPSQVTATTNSLAAKEAQILQIRALVNAAKAE